MADNVVEKSVFFGREHVKKYVEVPFDMPENVETFHFSYSYAKGVDNVPGKVVEDKNLVDLALIDCTGRQIGASGSSKAGFELSELYATPGYTPTELLAGEWKILFGLYHIKEEGVKIDYTLSYTYKKRRWLVGDCHLHTICSDGKYTPERIIQKCKKAKLDYMIITDHNNNLGYRTLPTEKDLLIIPGEELTSYLGHVNMWGSGVPFRGSFAVNDNDDMLRLTKEAKANGAILSVNHPHCKKCTWLLPLDEYPMDCVEVWNGPMRVDNMSTINWWHGQLLQGRHLAAVGGSDYHEDYVITDFLAEPTTIVYADSNTQKDVLSALVAGRSIIVKHPDTTRLFLTCGDKTIGDTVRLDECDTLTVRGEKMKRGHRLVVYNNDTLLYDGKIRRNGNLEMSLPIRESGFVRAEVRYQKKGLSALVHRIGLYFLLPEEAKAPIPEFIWAMTNPIWIDK